MFLQYDANGNLIATALRESGGATLALGAISDNQLLKRSGSSIVGATGGTPINVAAQANGATASASSTHSSGYNPSYATNGDRNGSGWGTNGGWNDGTSSAFPDWLEVDFNGVKSITEIDVFTLQDNYTSPVAPTPTMSFSLYGIVDFQVQYWDAGSSSWTTAPGGSITGNNLVWRKITFSSSIATSKIRVYVTASADGMWSRIVEVEAWGT